MKVVKATPVLHPEGKDAYIVTLVATSAPASLSVTGADVDGMADDAIVAAGSQLIINNKNYIALEDGVFTEKE